MSVKGLELEITSLELKTLVDQRAEYHANKATKLEEEVKRLGDVLEDLDDEAERIGKYSSSNNGNDPVVNLKSKAKVHRDRATYFKFFSEHIIPNEKYTLTQSDLSSIEVVGRGHW